MQNPRKEKIDAVASVLWRFRKHLAKGKGDSTDVRRSWEQPSLPRAVRI